MATAHRHTLLMTVPTSLMFFQLQRSKSRMGKWLQKSLTKCRVISISQLTPVSL